MDPTAVKEHPLMAGAPPVPPPPAAQGVPVMMTEGASSLYLPPDAATLPGGSAPAFQQEPVGALDPVEEFLGKPLKWVRPHESDVPPTTQGLRTLADAGAWNAVASLSDKCMQSPHPPDRLLHFKWYRIVALLKVRQFKQAADEMDNLGDLTALKYNYERYPDLYTGRKGSMVPFLLRLLHCEMPHYIGDHALALDRLYVLLQEVQAQRASEGDKVPAEIQHNHQVLVMALVNQHLVVRDYTVAISYLEQQIDLYPSESHLLSKLGRVHLQLGNVDAAEDAFNRLDCLLVDADANVGVRLNRGFLAVSCGDYEAALQEFEAVLQLDPGHIVAANNRAICLLYTCELAKAVRSLEDFLKLDPHRHLDQTLVLNLNTLYELMSDSANRPKKVLEQLVAALAPDDFDQVAAMKPSNA